MKYVISWAKLTMLLLLVATTAMGKSRIEKRITAFLPEAAQRTGMAVVVCPGGSYYWHDTQHEGKEVAEWLRDNGIAAFVLNYRAGTVPGFVFHYRAFCHGNRYPDMLVDVQEAMLYVRSHAAEWGIDPGRVGVMGFSAGGHLSAMAGEFGRHPKTKGPDLPVRPNFCVPCYPVVSMTAPCTHKRSRRGALGEWKALSRAMRDSLSLEKHVPADMPPTFIMNCVDDPIVHYHNSELLDSALTARGIPHVYHQFKVGGHGFGVNPKLASKEAIVWKELFLAWIKEMKL